MKLPYKLDSMELRNCNIGCRSACMYVCMYVLFYFFFALLAVFLTVLPSGIDLLGIRMKVDRNYRQERIPVGQPTGEVTFPDQGLLSAKHSWRYFRHSWWFLAVRSFPFSGSGGCLDSKIGTSSCTEKTWMSAGHGDLGCVLSNSGMYIYVPCFNISDLFSYPPPPPVIRCWLTMYFNFASYI